MAIVLSIDGGCVFGISQGAPSLRTLAKHGSLYEADHERAQRAALYWHAIQIDNVSALRAMGGCYADVRTDSLSKARCRGERKKTYK